jgi:hypothetical protein
MKLILKLIVIITVAIFSFNNYAWNALGHKVVANIAYERLQPEVRTKVDKMVSDLAKEYPEIHYFYDIAPWPDSIRSQKIELFTHWHYIDHAFSDDGTPTKNLIDTDNAVWALEKIQPVVGNAKANPYERARFLAFLVHIVGDIHQPLHTVARITAEHPDRDQGGNLFHIKYPPSKPQTITLHKLWDQGMDLLLSSEVRSLSDKVTSLYPESYFDSQLDDLSADNWAKEGSQIAQSFVYSTPENKIPSANYITIGTEIVEEWLALAGYRLANLLNRLLGS